MKSDILVCPACKGSLERLPDAFSCERCAQAYPFVNGIPDFYVEEADEFFTEENPSWRENLAWLDQRLVDARDHVYTLSVPDLKGMAFAMEQIRQRAFPGCRILEVGAGTGHFTRWMAETCPPGAEITAFDFSWPMLEKARVRVDGHPGVTLLRANAMGKIPFLPGSFDILLLRLAPLGDHGVDNLAASFELLKPGGWLVKAGWGPRPSDLDWPKYPLAFGFESAENHQWAYTRLRTREEYEASLVELELAIAHGAPYLPAQEPAWQATASRL